MFISKLPPGSGKDVAVRCRPCHPPVRRRGAESERIGEGAHDQRERSQDEIVEDEQQSTRLEIGDLVSDGLPTCPNKFEHPQRHLSPLSGFSRPIMMKKPPSLPPPMSMPAWTMNRSKAVPRDCGSNSRSVSENRSVAVALGMLWMNSTPDSSNQRSTSPKVYFDS